jgi:hypothetical protein
MDGRRVRHLASGALLCGSLVSGGTVGNVLLLGSAEHQGDPVGRLGAQLGSQPPAPAARGAGAAATRLVVNARGSRAAVLRPARVTIARALGAPVRQPSVTAPASTKGSRIVAAKPEVTPRVTTSKGARAAATKPIVTKKPTTERRSHEEVQKPEVTEPAETHTEHVEDRSHELEHKPEPEHPFDD